MLHLALSTLLIAVASTPGGPTSLIFVAFVPLLLFWQKAATSREVLKSGLWVGSLSMLPLSYWVNTALHEFGDLPWIACGLVWIAFSVFNGGLPLALYGVLRRRFAQWADWSLPLFGAVAYVAVDSYFPKVFQNTFGQLMADARWLRQIAALGGIALVTGFIFLFNEGVAQAFAKAGNRSSRAKRALRLVLPTIALLFALAYGWRTETQIQQTLNQKNTTLSVAVVQANIGNTLKKEAEKGQTQAWRDVVEDYLRRSELALELKPKPSVIVWPETAYPTVFTYPQKPEEQLIRRRLYDFVDHSQVTLIFGGYDFNPELQKVYNSMFVLRPQAKNPKDVERLSIYRKARLMPFGDTVPGAKFMPWIKEFFPYLGLFGSGAGPDVLTLPSPSGDPIKFAPLICYEGMFTDYTVEGGDLGAIFFINLTNDSWFGRYAQPYFHLQSTTFRSIETGRPQLRATNTGISALIYPDGSTSRRTPVYEADLLHVQVPLLKPTPTLIMKWGNWVPGVALAVVITLLGLEVVVRRLQRFRRIVQCA